MLDVFLHERRPFRYEPVRRVEVVQVALSVKDYRIEAGLPGIIDQCPNEGMTAAMSSRVLEHTEALEFGCRLVPVSNRPPTCRTDDILADHAYEVPRYGFVLVYFSLRSHPLLIYEDA